MQKLFIGAVALLATINLSAQDNPFGGGTPPKAELGTCYAKCYIPSQYETVTEEIQTKGGATVLDVIPAEYELVTQRVMVKEATTEFISEPAVYENITEQILVKEAGTRLVPVEPVYETVTEKVLIKEASTRWTMKRDENCMSANPDDCFVACYEEVPEQYTTYTSSVLKSLARVSEEEFPAEYKTVTKRMVKSPARVTERTIPAEYVTVTKQVLKTPASSVENTIAPEFETISKRKLVKAGEYSDWREILCDSKVTKYTIRQIQAALMTAGYDIGDAGVDNVMGAKTRAALMQYQKDKGLPVGNLNLETLQDLGVDY